MTIQEKMDETWYYCTLKYGTERCIAMCLHGSQNYECDLPDSDIDVKLIIAPTWREVVRCEQPLSKTINGPYGDINITDVRLYIGVNLKKQNFNFLETLFTPYVRVNPAYEDLWGELLQNRERIAHIDPAAAIRTMMGQVENQYGRWGRFDKRKTLYHMMRISSAIETYQQGLPFADTLIPINKHHIMRVREGHVNEQDMDFMFGLFYDHSHYCAKAPYKGVSYESMVHELDELQMLFVYRALYELRIEE